MLVTPVKAYEIIQRIIKRFQCPLHSSMNEPMTQSETETLHKQSIIRSVHSEVECLRPGSNIVECARGLVGDGPCGPGYLVAIGTGV